MELNKCSRCGVFHISSGDVCPNCMVKDNLELSTFKTYIAENGVASVDTIATQTGISQKNVNRFLGYEGLEIGNTKNLGNSGITLN